MKKFILPGIVSLSMMAMSFTNSVENFHLMKQEDGNYKITDPNGFSSEDLQILLENTQALEGLQTRSETSIFHTTAIRGAVRETVTVHTSKTDKPDEPTPEEPDDEPCYAVRYIIAKYSVDK